MSRQQSIRAAWTARWSGVRWGYNWEAHGNVLRLTVDAPADADAVARVMTYGADAIRHPCGCVTCEGVTLASHVANETMDKATLLALIGAASSPQEVLDILEMAGALA